MYDLRQLTTQNFQFNSIYIGKVVDNADPEYRDRLKCHISGFTENTNSDELPWCELKGDLFGGSNSTCGNSSVPKNGTYVYIEFLYGNPSYPIVSGYVRGNQDSSNVHKVANLGESIFNTRNTNMIGPELPPLNTSSTYPYNNVIETSSGVIEIDDSPNNERISIQLKNGSYFELRPNGDVQIKSQKDTYSLVKGNLEEFIQNCVNSVIKGNVIQKIGGLFDLTVDGGLQINNDVKILGNLETTQTITADGNITSKSEIADNIGQLSSLRQTFDIHTHLQNDGNDRGGGVQTNDPTQQVPTDRPTDFVFTSTAAVCGGVDVFVPPARIDSPEPYYTSNIKPSLEPGAVPEGYPTNSEQVEETNKQVEDGVVGTQKNPMEIGEQMLNMGAKAWQETGKNPNIKQLWDEIGYDGNKFADQTAWCAVFVSAVLKRSGNKYLKTASSQAYNSYGKEVPHISQAKVGDLVIFYRKGNGSGYGHVGIYAGKFTETHIAVLGGNQSDNLNIRYFKRNDPSKGWGIRSIRRAVSAEDGTSVPPDYNFTIPSSVYNGGKVT